MPSWMWCHQELVAEVLLPLEVQAALTAWAGLAVLPQNLARLGDRGGGDLWPLWQLLLGMVLCALAAPRGRLVWQFLSHAEDSGTRLAEGLHLNLCSFSCS